MFLVNRMTVDKSLHRIRQLSSILRRQDGENSKHSSLAVLSIRNCSSNKNQDAEFVRIGDISKQVRQPSKSELVPVKYLPKEIPQSSLRHLRWIMQKDVLGQDVFLIGAPGPVRRQLAMMYLELTKREGEYVSLSRDTTETDLKQRREIRSGSAFYLDQCAVRAATEGRVLVLEGIEKAERNVLPILNNLLENREMQLDDGRFLVAADRYDKLLQDHTKTELDDLKLVRVDERFRVIALGLPVPRYQGNPLDPPLRSRFQARDVHTVPFKEQLDALRDGTSQLPTERLSQILSFATTMLTDESTALGLPDFPMSNLESIVKILNTIPTLSSAHLLERLYPFRVMLGKEGTTAVEDMLVKFELSGTNEEASSISSMEMSGHDMANVTMRHKSQEFQYQVPSGSLKPILGGEEQAFVATRYHDSFLSDIMQSHMTKDFCIIGARGCGKSRIVRKFADSLGYHIEPIMLYQDMTARDLLQQRTTLKNGDTTWRLSPLVTAALEGSLAVLDGVHRINPGSFAVLHRLVHERELQLFDGSRLLRHDRYEHVKNSTGLSEEQLTERNIHKIHPSFRIVALSEPPVVGSSSQQWLSPELLTMFLYHNMRQLSQAEESEVIKTLVPECPDLSKLLAFVHSLRTSHDSTLLSIASSLSTRQLLRVARRLESYPSEDLYSVVQKACLSRFLPRLAKSGLEQALEEAGIEKQRHTTLTIEDLDQSLSCEVKDGMLRIGQTRVAVYDPENRTKVPDVLFYENPQHLVVLEDMLKDFMLGEHLLLIGNQGVGKNKIIDRFLHLLNRPREYVQLHRDTTVQTLTLQPTVQDGVIVYEDSPLVRAVKLGHVLVVDEADKAPTHVTCILKTLVESGEMHLADGRRIVAANSGIKLSPSVIVAHPHFRMVVLANRPGFPFLGNDFFSAMGDIFSCHAIDNPDMESEMSMLRQYGPDVPESTLKKLVLAFGELRDMADQGLIAYPYSTREVVNMVKHLQKFPSEGLTTVVKNVFDFDSYNKELQESIVQTMQKHGVPLGADLASVNLAKEFDLPEFELKGNWQIASQGERKRTSLMQLPVETHTINVKGPVTVQLESSPLDRNEARTSVFTEQEAFWNIPMQEYNVVCDIAVTKADHRSPGHTLSDVIHVATANPISLYSMNPRSLSVNFIDLYDVFPTTVGSFRPKVRLMPLSAPLDDSVILHEEVTNVVLSVNFENGQIMRLISPSLPETPIEKRRFTSVGGQKTSPYKMCVNSLPDPYGNVIFHKVDGDTLVYMNVLEGISHTVSLPLNLQSIHQVAPNSWLLSESSNKKKYFLERGDAEKFILRPIHEDKGRLIWLQLLALSDGNLTKALQQQISSPNRVIMSPDAYASILLGFPDLTYVDVYSSPRDGSSGGSSPEPNHQLMNLIGVPPKVTSASPIAILPESVDRLKTLPQTYLPRMVRPDCAIPRLSLAGLAMTLSHPRDYPPVAATRVSPYASWLFTVSDSGVFLAPMSNDGLVTVDMSGCVRLWETSLLHLNRSLTEWRNMIGFEDSRPLQMTYERESGREPEMPKHGKEDPSNQPHVGGNTWAGGV
ncbi:hypothetical protein ScPMuIL_008953, partial [Solemya velum]